MHGTCYKAPKLAINNVKVVEIAASFLASKTLKSYLCNSFLYYSSSKKLG